MSSVRYTFVWSQRELTLREFVSRYRDRLPVLAKVSQGLCGSDDSTFSFATNEEFYITHVNTQKRIIAKDTKGRNLSMPTEYPIRFQELYRGKTTGHAPLPLCELVDSGFHPGMRLTPEDKANLQFWVGADETKKTEIEELEVVDMYEDSYLVGNSVIGGQLQDCPQYIPLFLSIKFNIAEGLMHGSQENFYKVVSTYYHKVDLEANKKMSGNPEIMLYTDTNESVATEYTYLEPRSIIACAQTAMRKTGWAERSSIQTHGSVKKGKQSPPKVLQKPISRSSTRVSKPLPPLPCDVEGQPVQLQQQQQSTRQPKSPLGSKSPPVVPVKSELDLRSVKLKHVERSMSSCVNPDYQNWTKRQNIVPPNQRMSMQERRRESLYDVCDAYQEIPADFDEEVNKSLPSTEKHEARVLPQEVRGEKVEYEIKDEGSGYMRVGDVPRNFKDITIKGVGECLKLLHLNQYVEKFEENLIDGSILMTLDIGTLKTDLSMTQLDATKLHKFVQEGWRPR